MRYINLEKNRVVEGEYRFKELLKFVEDHKTVKIVWLAEDATAVISKIKYDPITNQLVGLLLPTNSKNGSPIPFSFIAKNAEVIRQIVNSEPCSKSVYVVLAQVLDERIPPFILQMYGTNGSFTGGDVIRRWHYTKSELERYKNVMGFFIY